MMGLALALLLCLVGIIEHVVFRETGNERATK